MDARETCEVVALFHDERAMEQALTALGAAGISPDNIELLASCATVETKLGDRFKSVKELEDQANVPRIAYVPSGARNEFQHTLIGVLTYVATGFGLILASSAGLANMLIAATAAGGTAVSVGEALAWLVGHRDAHRLLDQLNCGGLLIWVRADSEAQAHTVVHVLKERGGDDVHLRDPDRIRQSNTPPTMAKKN